MPSLVEAIASKYGPDDADAFGDGIPIAIYVPKKGPRNIVPSLLVLNDCSIDSAGDEEDLCDKCGCVEELDLAQNNLTRWSEILSILRQMPRVKFANLSFNNLADDLSVEVPETKPTSEVPAEDGSKLLTEIEPCPDLFPLLKNLVLNSTQVQWASVRRILRLLPNLEELHLSLNGYNSVELGQEPSDIHSKVKRLHFIGNPVKHWSEVSHLGRVFPNLESLVLAECPVQSLDPLAQSSECSGECQRLTENGESKSRDDCCGSPLCSFYGRSESECESAGPKPHSAHDVFRQLRFLNLNNTLLSTWDDVDRLALFPNLHCLRIQGCPLFEFPQEYTEHERRQLLIARLPNVQTLNGGGVISMEEREDAERAFIRYYMEKPESDRPERYTDLLHVHGRLEPLVNIDLTPEKRVKVNFICGDNMELKSINVYQTVSELKQKLEAFSGIAAPKMRLFYVDQELKALTGPEEMKFPNKQLYSYNIASGDEILVDSKVSKV